MEYHVQLTWDPEAAVWIAESEDLRGLVMEDASMDALIRRVCAAAPELLELNHQPPAKEIRFLAARLEQIPAA